MSELGSVAGWLLVLPLIGMAVVLAGKTVGDLWDKPKVPRWHIYLMMLALGAAVVYLPTLGWR